MKTWEELSEEERKPYFDKAVKILQNYYTCTRVWSAWRKHCGTMTQDDFALAAEDDNIISDTAKILFDFVDEQPLQPDNGDYTNTNKLGENEMDFEKELEMLINKYSKENESDTPDFILVQYLKGCLDNYAETVKARDKWYCFEGLS